MELSILLNDRMGTLQACEVQCLPAYDRPTDGSAEDPVFDPADELLLEILVLHQYLMMLGTLPEGARYRDEMAILTAAAEQLESEELATIMQPLEAMALAGDTKAEEVRSQNRSRPLLS